MPLGRSLFPMVFARAFNTFGSLMASLSKGVCALGTNGVNLMLILRLNRFAISSTSELMAAISSSVSVGSPIMK